MHGHLEGTLIATERLILSSSARVTGHIEAPLIRIDDGAHFTGEVEMALDGAAPAAPARQSFTTPTRAAATAPARAQAPVRAAAPAPAQTPRAAAPPQAAAQPAAISASTTTVVVQEVEEEEDDREALTQELEEPLEESLAGSTLDPAILAEYDDQTVKELREELRRLDLPVSGTKQELIERLVEAKQ